MTVRDDLLSAARALLIAVTSAEVGQVINAGAKGPRPDLPYLTVRLTSPGGTTQGPAERLDRVLATVPQVAMQERREASISVQAFGKEALDWLDNMHLLIDSPLSLLTQASNFISAMAVAPPSDISVLLDTIEESRYSFEMLFRYRAKSDPADQTELLTADVSLEVERFADDPDKLDYDFTIDLT